MARLKNLFVVRQTNPCCCYDNYTIAIYSDFKKAIELSRKLNKKDARGVSLTDKYDFIEIENNFDYDVNYYDIEAIPYDEPFETYGV